MSRLQPIPYKDSSIKLQHIIPGRISWKEESHFKVKDLSTKVEFHIGGLHYLIINIDNLLSVLMSGGNFH